MAATKAALRKKWNGLEDRNKRAQKELLRVLELAIEDFAETYQMRPIASLAGKMKTWESFCDKALRFQDEGRANSASECFSQIGDIVRARVTCQTLADVHRLRAMLEHKKSIVLGAPVFDDKESGTKTGYRGLHLNAFVAVQDGDDLVKVPCEVQIHTALQSAWSLYTHGDFYKGAGVPPLVGDLMKQLSDLLYVADGLADRLLREVQRTSTGPAGSGAAKAPAGARPPKPPTSVLAQAADARTEELE